MFLNFIKRPFTHLPGLVKSFQSQFNVLFSATLLSIVTFHPAFAQTPHPSIQNDLLQNSSPYLAMHGHDPVNWKLWNKDVLKTAQQKNKLVFISSGYFSCHWCHVMQRENYQDPTTADYLNKHFVSVKIDRELNPELDKTLIEFAQKATGQAGWPQHVILTPSGYPFVSFIYLPTDSFQKTLKRIVKLWNTKGNEVESLAKKAALADSKIITGKVNQQHISTNAFQQRLLEQVNQAKDDLSGGLKSTSKFPKAPLLNALLKIKELPEDIEDWLQLTLDQMQSEHLFDHVHGGFYRYTVDPNWQIPHFEKMAYTNALLAQSYLTAGQRWQRQDYLQTAKMTLDYLQTHLFNSQTQLYQSSQSAIDKNNDEGADYLWTKNQLKAKLSAKEFQLVEQAWSLDHSPPYEFGWHPSPISFKESWQKIRAKLQTPVADIPVDTKSILGWNGLVLSALSQAYDVLGNKKYLQQANQLADRLSLLIQQNPAHRALSKTGEPMGEANLQDYAFIKQGLLDYQTLTKNKQYKTTLLFINKTLTEQFYSATGWKYGATPILPQQKGEWLMVDGPIPSPTALVSCLKPKSIKQNQERLLAQAMNYPSYLTTLNCIQKPLNPVK